MKVFISDNIFNFESSKNYLFIKTLDIIIHTEKSIIFTNNSIDIKLLCFNTRGYKL